MSNYWKERFLKEEQRVYELSEEEIKKQIQEYDKAIASLNKDIEIWYNRIAKNNDVSLAEAKRLLSAKELKEFRWTVDEYIKHGKENGITKDWSKQLENASARVHIERLEALKLQTRGQIEKLYNGRESGFKNFLKNVYTDQHQRTAFEFAKETGVGTNFYKINENLVEDIIKKPWALDGKNFSDRIWSDKEKLINTLHTEMTQGFIRGDSLEYITKRITAKMNVSKSNVKRLVRTESAAYRSKAQLKAFQDLEVEKYQVLATLDSRTSEICQDMDGKVFDFKDYEIGTTAPPFHVNCRSVTIPYFDNEEEGERTARDPETGKTIYVSDKMTYKEWKQKFLIDNEKDGLKNDENKGIIEIEEIRKNSKIIKALNDRKIEYNEVKELDRELEEWEIISRIAGGDKTDGSCSSVAFAYVGNKNGLDVLDFRDGDSRKFFAKTENIIDIANLDGVKSYTVTDSNDFKAMKELLEYVEYDKDYYLAIGRHAAIIRRDMFNYYYLELQTEIDNGFKNLNDKELKKRFGCQKSYASFGLKLKSRSVLIDIDSLKDNKEFKEILGYINTNVEKQVKGEGGYAK